jgi:hypothetical protein
VGEGCIESRMQHHVENICQDKVGYQNIMLEKYLAFK